LGSCGWSTFKLRWYEAADVDVDGRVDEGELRLSRDSRNDSVNSSEFIANIVTIAIIDGDDLPPFGGKTGIWLNTGG
jgi:hypothetical protein